MYNQNRCPWSITEPSILPGRDSPKTLSPYKNGKQCYHPRCDRCRRQMFHAPVPPLPTWRWMVLEQDSSILAHGYLQLSHFCVVEYLSASLASSHLIPAAYSPHLWQLSPDISKLPLGSKLLLVKNHWVAWNKLIRGRLHLLLVCHIAWPRKWHNSCWVSGFWRQYIPWLGVWLLPHTH